MNFEFATSNRIIFGRGAIKQAGKLIAEHGTHTLIITGSKPERASVLTDQLTMPFTLFPVDSEPTIELARAGVQAVREHGCDVVVSIGGGSVLDAGKAIAALATNDGDPLDYLEVIGQGKALVKPPLPFIAIPTTAGTGAEVTRNAVLASQKERVKVSLRSALMLPDVALVDPELTLSMPESITAATGMDALTQVLEPYVSRNANPLTDAIAHEGLIRAGRSLRKAYQQGDDLDAREDMALVSLFGGLALANAKLGAVHGFAGVLGGMFPAPHGAVCAALLPHVVTVNVRALQAREPDHPALKKYDEIGRLLTGNPNATAQDAVDWIHETGKLLNIPPLSEYGISEADFDEIIDKSRNASSMKGNPITLTDEELREILVLAC